MNLTTKIRSPKFPISVRRKVESLRLQGMSANIWGNKRLRDECMQKAQAIEAVAKGEAQ